MVQKVIKSNFMKDLKIYQSRFDNDIERKLSLYKTKSLDDKKK
jgi:hypothetical protein